MKYLTESIDFDSAEQNDDSDHFKESKQQDGLQQIENQNAGVDGSFVQGSQGDYHQSWGSEDEGFKELGDIYGDMVQSKTTDGNVEESVDTDELDDSDVDNGLIEEVEGHGVDEENDEYNVVQQDGDEVMEETSDIV